MVVWLHADIDKGTDKIGSFFLVDYNSRGLKNFKGNDRD